MQTVGREIPSAALAHLKPEFREIFSEPTTSIVNAGRVLGRGRSTSYKMVRDGLMPTTLSGEVSTAWLARQVGLLPSGESLAA